MFSVLSEMSIHLEMYMYIHRIFLKLRLWSFFLFLSKNIFPKFELPNYRPFHNYMPHYHLIIHIQNYNEWLWCMRFTDWSKVIANDKTWLKYYLIGILSVTSHRWRIVEWKGLHLLGQIVCPIYIRACTHLYIVLMEQ